MMRIHKPKRTGLATFAVLMGGLLFGAPAVFAAGPPEAPLTGPSVGAVYELLGDVGR